MALQQVPDYLSQFQGIADPGQALQQSFQQGLARQVAQAQQQRALNEQAQLDAAKKAAITNPTGANYRALMVLDPKGSEAIKRAHDSLNEDERSLQLKEVGSLYSYLQSGRSQEAKSILQRRIDADRKAGVDVADDESMLDLIDEDPKAAASAVGYQLATTLGPDKFDAGFGAVRKAENDAAKLPGEIAKTGAETTKLATETAQIPANAESERGLRDAQITKMQQDADIAAQRLGLDTERLKNDIATTQAKLDIDLNTAPAQALPAINAAVTEAASSRQLAERAGSLADQLIAKKAAGGLGANLASALTGITGDASAITQLRREYTQIRGAQAVKNLPPGPASDKDIQLALKGFPPPSASGETLASFLYGMQKLQNIVADSADRKAEWLSGNRGSLGPARTGFFVGNDFVTPGTKYDDIEKQYRQQRSTAAAGERAAGMAK